MIESITSEKSSNMQNRVLQVASSFTSRPLAATLRPLLISASVADEVGFIEYAQLSEYMLGPASDREQIVGTVVLVRVEDWLREDLKAGTSGTDSDSAQKARQGLTAHVDEFVKQITSLARRGKPVWLLVCPSNGWVSESYQLMPLCRTYTNLLLARVRNTKILVLPWPSTLAGAEINDCNTDRLGQIPFTLAAFEQLSRFLGRQIETALASRAATVSRAPSNGNSDLAKFLAGLGVRVRLAVPEATDRAHVDRILRSAAAFSLTGEKRDLSEAQVDRILATEGCLLISVSDKLSRYGPSGIVTFRREADSLVVDALALSCPVLGKQVEYAVISGLAQIAASQGCTRLVFEYRASGRNQMMLTFLQSITAAAPEMGFILEAAAAEERIQKTAVAPGTWTLESEGNLWCAESRS